MDCSGEPVLLRLSTLVCKPVQVTSQMEAHLGGDILNSNEAHLVPILPVQRKVHCLHFDAHQKQRLLRAALIMTGRSVVGY